MFDRLIFKGHLTAFYRPGAVRAFLWSQGVPLTRFAEYLRAVIEDLTAHANRLATEAHRPCLYLEHATTRTSGQTNEDLTRTIAARDEVSEGLVCVLSVVES